MKYVHEDPSTSLCLLYLEVLVGLTLLSKYVKEGILIFAGRPLGVDITMTFEVTVVRCLVEVGNEVAWWFVVGPLAGTW